MVLQEREYHFEDKKTPYYGDYYFNDTPLSSEDNFDKKSKQARKLISKNSNKLEKPTWDF